MGFLSKKLRDEERAEDLFSPYIDSRVTVEERQFLERYLAQHPDAREKFDLLKTAVQLTKTLPAVKAPRSFVLPRSMARRPSLAMRWYPIMRLATVAAMALFAFAFVGDLATQTRLAPASLSADMSVNRAAVSPSPTPAPTTEAAMMAAPAETSAASATAAPLPTQTPLATGKSTQTDSTAEATGNDLPGVRDETATPLALAEAQVAPTATTAATSAPATTMRTAESPAQPVQMDLLRLTWMILAGLAVVFLATVLILRRRI
jgi:cytoskeletal protein RodZ